MGRFQCPYCGVGCGLIVDERGRIKGDRLHPANYGDVCKKPLYLPKVYDKGRVEKPLYRESKEGEFREISWEEAYGILAEKLSFLNPKETYFYISGQLLTEDSYVINKFVKGFLGVNNIDANSRLCMASAVTAYKLVFGSDGPPCSYEDLDDADAFIFIGSNAAITHPVLFKRVLRARRKKEKAYIITIDPYETETARKSDVHIQIRAGTDAALLNSVLYVLYEEGCIDWGFINNYTEGFEEVLKVVQEYPPEVAASLCGISEEEIYLLAEVFAESEKVITLWCQGINQSSSGVAKNLAILNLHLATGRLNERGCPFSLTGQPNAMGGREVGYLTNGLPGYRDVRREEDRKFVAEVWGVERISEKPGPTITEAIDLILKGEIRFLWVVCTNPAVSLPDLTKVRKALREVFLVVQDAYFNDTAEFANLILPASPVPEKEGIMTGSDRTVSLCEKLREPLSESKPDWLIFTELAKKMGGEKLFPYRSSREIFEEFKKLLKGRVCDYSSFTYETLPGRWGGRWLYEGLTFHTPSGKARFFPAEVSIPQEEGDFILVTGRLKNQWHTMTRTGKVKELLKGEVPPFVVINPADAEELGIKEWDRVRIYNSRGEVVRVAVFGNVKRGHLFAPFGYPHEYGEPINVLLSDRKDPLSAQPELKYAGVYLERIPSEEEALDIPGEAP